MQKIVLSHVKRPIHIFSWYLGLFLCIESRATLLIGGE